MKKVAAAVLTLFVAFAVPVTAEQAIQFDPVEKDLMLKESVRDDLAPGEKVEVKKGFGNKWLYVLLGVGLLGAAAGGGGDGGGDGGSVTGTVDVSW